MDNQRKGCSEFQEAVAGSLLRHRSILDVLSKLQETNARVHRAVIKAVTECGCVSVDAAKQSLPENCTYTDLREHFHSHLRGDLCDTCTEVLEQEIGNNLFYIAGLCSTLGLDLSEVLEKEAKRLSTLGMYHLR